MNWLLPEALSDVLPGEAARIERLRRELLDLFRASGYALVMPPHLEYLESLLTGAGQDLNLRTFKLVDQLSGRTLGVRADMTPQVARIDAHLLNRSGVTRLCYCDSVLHTLPATPVAGREPLQLGAELYGYAGLSADQEMIRLMADVLAHAALPSVRIDIGHVGIFRAIVAAAKLPDAEIDALLSLLQSKDEPGLAEACSVLPDDSPAHALKYLPKLYGGPEMLGLALEKLPDLPAIRDSLGALETLFEQLPDLDLSLDLADLRGYHYHNGLVFAAYCQGYPAAIASGGRYDGAGAAFGRSRPATGFSTDLRELVRLSPATSSVQYAIRASLPVTDEQVRTLRTVVARLRTKGEVVIETLPGEALEEDLPDGTLCDRALRYIGGHWVIEAL